MFYIIHWSTNNTLFIFEISPGLVCLFAQSHFRVGKMTLYRAIQDDDKIIREGEGEITFLQAGYQKRLLKRKKQRKKETIRKRRWEPVPNCINCKTLSEEDFNKTARSSQASGSPCHLACWPSLRVRPIT